MRKDDLKELLDELYFKYNNISFIEADPISIPHRFVAREDIEISGFLASTIAWGNRKAIVKSAARMMDMMDDSPYDFTVNASASELEHLSRYVHRTFNGGDFITFIGALRRFYDGSIEGTLNMGQFFERSYRNSGDMRTVLSDFYKEFWNCEHEQRTRKHLSSIDKKAACKRVNMYLRWLVRKDDKGVDFGLWDIPCSALYLPLDVHTANMSRELGLLTRKQNDWKAVEEVTESLRLFDPNDPVKYDYALFGAGIDGFLKK
ncbi:MAG: TIGR02757 family protein [Rikenellaceae bacterium]